ncbi:MAG TPA: DJ-1/PfpI family protein [Bacillus sp. (in: firmicutes)]|uniref:DJ-1/PfpI family protein n=1 Tax=Bacillus litorisediminis TaxID=2922713 RepID=UPI001FAB6769|nr:DJ-1/PfpI family protein [Bacillus litorisediminis]HWO75154.1 DJ-1/PfpI family protein [Bacillus sp. (in: firmicutes)]
MSKKVLILAGDAVEALEVFYPYYRLLEEGYEVTIAAPQKKKLQTVVHDFTGWDTYEEKLGYLLEANAVFSEVDPTEYEGLVIPGGRAPEYIRLEKDVQAIVKHFFEENKPIAAICHASLIFETIPEVLKGRTLTAYIACKPGVEIAGGNYVSESTSYVDGNLVSAHAWPDLPSFMREFLQLLKNVSLASVEN